MLVELQASIHDRPRRVAEREVVRLLNTTPIMNWPKRCLTCRTTSVKTQAYTFLASTKSIHQDNINTYYRVFPRRSDSYRLIGPFVQKLNHVFLAGIFGQSGLHSPRKQWLHERHVSDCHSTLCASGHGILNMPQCIQLGTVSPHCGLSTSTYVCFWSCTSFWNSSEPTETCVPASRRQTGVCAEAVAASCGHTTCARGGSDGNHVCCVLCIAPDIMAMPRHTSLTPS
jgi:hypothetical protein